MKLKSFSEFYEDYLALESIRHIDERIFKPFLQGKYNMTENQLKQWERQERIIKEDSEQTWLQNDEEVELIKIYQDDPNSKEGREAMDKLVENKIPYIKSKVGKFIAKHPNAISYKDDMEQEALIALTNAVEKFDTSRGIIFNGFLNKQINGVLFNMINPLRQKSIVDGKGDSHGNNRVSTISLDTKIGGDNGEWADKEQTVADKVADDSQMQPWEQADDEHGKHIAVLHDWYEQLPEDERLAIQMYFPSDYEKKPATLEEIGRALGGMSKMGAQKLINRIIIKLRKLAEAEGWVVPPEGGLENNSEFYDNIIKIAKGKKN